MPLIKLNATQGLTGALPAVSGASLTGISADFVKLQTQEVTGSSVANVTFTSTYMTSTYQTYLIHGFMMFASNGQYHLYCYPSINNGSNYNLDIAANGGGRYNNVKKVGDKELILKITQVGNILVVFRKEVVIIDFV